MLIASDLFISLFALCYFILSPFHALVSTVILCSFTHLFSSSFLMLPVVHHRLGMAPKQAESQWCCRSLAESQSHLNLNTAQPPVPLSAPFSCFHFVSALSFNSISWSSPFLHLSLYYSSVSLPTSHSIHFLPVCSQTHCFWTGLTLNPDFCFLYSPFLISSTSNVSVSFQTILHWMKWNTTSGFCFGRPWINPWTPQTGCNVILKTLQLWFQHKRIPQQ